MPSGPKRLISRGTELLARLRDRFGWLDHAIRAYQHYSTVKGNRLAAAVTYFGFLSLFPLLALAFAAFGFVLRNNPDLEEKVFSAISDALPGFVGEGAPINPERLKDAATAAGIIGAVALLYTGTGLVDAIREALHVVWNRGDVKVNFVVRKLLDIVLLVVLGILIIVSVGVSSAATSFANVMLDLLGLEGLVDRSRAARGADDSRRVAVGRCGHPGAISPPVRRLAPACGCGEGAIVGAVGVEILKLLATSLLGGASNPVYATIGIVVGLLLWISFIGRTLILAASWTVTLRPAPATGPAPVAVPMQPVATPGSASRRPGLRGALAGAAVLVMALLRRKRS